MSVLSPGQTVFHIDDLVIKAAFDKENERVRKLGLNPATGQIWKGGKPKRLPATTHKERAAFMEIADWFVKYRRAITVKEMRPIATKYFPTEKGFVEFLEYLKSSQGEKEFRRELRDAMRRHGISMPPEEEYITSVRELVAPSVPATITQGEPIPDKYKWLIPFIGDEPLPPEADILLPAVEVAEGERKIDAVLRQLADGVESIQGSTQFRLFLTTMAKFHNYSYANQILIALQKPNATRVAGFVTWKDLGRWVKKDERGIAILAPIFPPKPKKEEAEEELPLTPVYFKVVHVFDVSQTEGKPLPEFEVPVLTGEANEELFAKVFALAKAQGLDVSFESRPHQDPSIKGQYIGKSIWVRPEEPRAQQLKSLLHEVAHYYSEGVFRIPRRDAETIAESAAFTVGAHFSFDTGVRSFPYVALWAQDKKVLKQNLASIHKVARVMLESLEKMQGAGEKLLPALKPFEPYKFAEYVLRANAFSLYEIPIYSGLTGTNPLRVPDHIWQEVLESIDGEFVKQGDLYIVKTPGVERPPDMRAAPTWREVTATEELTPATIDLLAKTEGDPLRKFCCRQCGECAPTELLEEGRFPDRIAWLRHHYKANHPGMWGKAITILSAPVTPEVTGNTDVKILVGSKLWRTFGTDIQRFANKRLAVIDVDDLIAHLNAERMVAAAGNVPIIDDIVSKLQNFKKAAIPKAEAVMPEAAVIPTEPSPTPNPKQELEFVADSPEYIPYTLEQLGLREPIDKAFTEAIARAKGA